MTPKNVSSLPSRILTIQKCVAEHYGLALKEMVSAQRTRNVARPRMMAMYLSWVLTNYGFSTIGRAFNKNHSTVLHATKVIKAMLKQYPEMEADKAKLTTLIAQCKEPETAGGALFLPVSHPKSEVADAHANR